MTRLSFALIAWALLTCGVGMLATAQVPMTGGGKGAPGGGGGTNIALVAGQTTNNTSGFGTSPLTLTLPNNPTTGNLVVVCAVINVSDTTFTVADSNGNNYTASTSSPFTGSAVKLGIYYLVAGATATKTITGTIGVPTGTTTGWAAEFSGANAAPFERDNTQSFGGGSATINTPSTTTTNNGDLLLGCANGYSNINSANSPWTGIAAIVVTSYAEYFIQTTAGAQAINFTQASSTFWDGMIAAFKK